MDLAAEILHAPGGDASAVHRLQVTLSYAQSIDGSIAREAGKPTPLSGAETQVLTHALRASHDAILVGIGTILADNARLTVRLVAGRNPQPVVLDTHLRLPLDANVLNHPDRAPWVVCGAAVDPLKQSALERKGARVIRLPTGQRGWLDLPGVLQKLESLGLRTLLVEGGAQVLTSFLCACLADRVVITVAPCFLGGYRGFAPGAAAQAGSIPRLADVHSEVLGADIVIWGRPG